MKSHLSPILRIILLFALALALTSQAAAAPEPPAKPTRAVAGTPAPLKPPARSTPQMPFHKALAAPGVLDGGQPGVTLWHDYGAFALYRIADETAVRLAAQADGPVIMDASMDTILFDRHPLDGRTGELDIPAALTISEPQGAALHLVQFVGPIKQAWLDAIAATGSTPIHYVANNAYLVWADAASRGRLDALARDGDFLQYSGPQQPGFKLGPSAEKRIVEQSDPDEIVPVDIQIYSHAGQEATQALIEGLAVERLSDWWPILAYENIALTVRAGDLLTIARLNDVVWVGERFPRTLNDEVQGQILAGHFAAGQSGPSGPGYLAWLDGLGFSQDPAAYPVVSITDDGIGTGSVTNGAGDVTLTRLGDGVTTRLAFIANCTNDANGGGVDGHGHINTSITGGYDVRAGFPFRDPLGYQRGEGINPYGRLAGTKIFNSAGSYNVSKCSFTDTGVIKVEQDSGAVISSNSWGSDVTTYDTSSQAYDVGVRDADLTEAGNQPMIYVFAAGNAGSAAGTVGSPGNGKNMITVGASENRRPSDEDGSWTDGCGTTSSEADNAMDVVGFSSRGPVAGGRVKPEVIAPGTHIQGTASTNTGYTGNGVCDMYRPSGQTAFAASSGTSHSTPAIAGVASLYYAWLQNHYAVTPSPALMKAYLIAHPTYLTGVSANDTLPSNNQGYGMPDMSTAFDSTPRVLVNQTTIFDNSGETWTWNGSVADLSKPLRIVLAYSDAAGAIGTSPQVNNLNLAAVVNGANYLGNHFSGRWSTTGGSADTANNYEAIFLPAGTTGSVAVTITGFNIAGDGVRNSGDATDQDFALVCYNCAQTPDFGLTVAPASQNVCAPAAAAFTATLSAFNGFNAPVTLSASGQPTGTTASFSANPVTPPGSSVLTIGNTDAAPAGTYTITVSGASGALSHQTSAALSLSAGLPATATLSAPANGSTGQAATPTFTWNAVAGATSYDIQVATDPGFTTISAQASGLTGASYTPPTALAGDTVYYWRVQAVNACGGRYAATAAFRTQGGAVCSNVIGDGGFEAGQPNPAWSESSAIGYDIVDNTSGNARTGAWSAWLGGDDSENSQVWQASAISTSATSTTLTYWYQIDSTDLCNYDYGYLKINGSTKSTYKLCSTTATSGGYVQATYDMLAYKGTLPEVRFQATTDDSYTSSFFIDDVALNVCTTTTSTTADYGDLPSSYGAAWHSGSGALRMGSQWTTDSSFAAGADNASDDGVAFVGAFGAGGAATVRVNVQGTPAAGRWLRLWFDWDGDGAFAPGERVYDDAVAGGDNDLTVSVPAGVSAAVAYRARLYDAASAPAAAAASDGAAYGGASSGEVEDGSAPCAVPGSVSSLAIARLDASQVQLTWAAAAGADHYEVWSAVNEPYFTPGADCAAPDVYGCTAVAATSSTHAGLGDPASNRTYRVRAVSACGAPGVAPSVGGFNFALESGLP